MEYEKRTRRREENKNVDSMLGNNRTFDWKVALSRIIISDDRLKNTWK